MTQGSRYRIPVACGRRINIEQVQTLGILRPKSAPLKKNIASRQYMDIADHAVHAVELRAHHHLKTPDAIQLGTAVACGADYIITNDRDWRRIEEIQVVMVGDL